MTSSKSRQLTDSRTSASGTVGSAPVLGPLVDATGHDGAGQKPEKILARVRAWMIVLPLDAILLMSPMLWNPHQFKATIAMTAISLIMVSGRGRYRARLHLSVLDELPNLLGNLLTAAAVVATVFALRHDGGDLPTFLIQTAISIVLVVAGRVLTTQLITWSRRHRVTIHRTIVIGGGPLATELVQILAAHPRYGLSVVGFVDDGDDCIAQALVPQFGGLSELNRAVVGAHADVLLIADGEMSERALLDAVRTPACVPCDLLIIPRMHQFHTQTGLADHIGSIPIMRIRTPSLNGPARLVKRGFDVAVATLLLIVASPVLAICAVAVRLEGRGVIFHQPRVGRNGELFDCLKFRSMRPVDDTESGTNWSIANDNRVSRVGRLLRRTSLDELPQLWNILRGDMTLVGPRPERPYFVRQFSAQYDRYEHRHRVQAGLTGLAQVSGLRGDTSIADRALYDNYYIENWSLWLDLKIIVRTFSEVFFARGR